jgi:hypothetical protein
MLMGAMLIFFTVFAVLLVLGMMLGVRLVGGREKKSDDEGTIGAVPPFDASTPDAAPKARVAGREAV